MCATAKDYLLESFASMPLSSTAQPFYNFCRFYYRNKVYQEMFHLNKDTNLVSI